MFNTILIANRGEIAMRVIRTARNMGYRTVAVYSEADVDAPHVQAADTAVFIGKSDAAASYLSVEKIIEAARLSGADAVHPGYGFLAENAAFARACKSAELVFIGPDADAMELMGSKRLSKEAMLKAGVPCIPGYQGMDQSDAVLIAEAEKIGLPVMVKASAGGGGRGMRLVTDASLLAESIRNARAEARSSCGSGELILEKAIIEPRHIEIQVFADCKGNVIYLGERDCSIQRRHQKVVEEAPSPFVDPTLRRKMGDAAVNAAIACGYRGAGTVEFLVDANKDFYFLEMNTRLQVEHPVTEMITGLDLVAWQIKVACGALLPLTQEEINFSGHAIEVRLYAEDPRRSFLPQTGEVLAWEMPDRKGVRIDCGIVQGQEINSYYDPLLAKIIAWGENRSEARRRLSSALKDTVLLGFDNNKYFLERIIEHPVFVRGEATTGFLERHFNLDISMSEDLLPGRTLALAAMLTYQCASPHYKDAGWQNPAPYRYLFKFGLNGHTCEVAMIKKGRQFIITLPDKESFILEWVRSENNVIVYTENSLRRKCAFTRAGDGLFIDNHDGHFIITNRTLESAAAMSVVSDNGNIQSNMNGRVAEVLVNVDDLVETGQALVILEAMKMQQQLSATINGRVSAVMIAAGDQVKPGQLLVQLTAEEAMEQAHASSNT